MIDFTKKLALKAGKRILELRRRNLDFHFKKDGHVVTNADIESEKLIIHEIENNFSGHSIYSEEVGLMEKKSNYLWVIDPLDGTNNYLRNLGPYTVSIALAFKKRIVLGVVYNPKTKELFYAEKGKNAFLNNEKITVNKQTEFKKSLIYVSSVGKSIVFLSKLIKTFNGSNIRTLTSTAYDLCGVAVGRSEGLIKIIDPISKKGNFVYGEDFSAASLIVEEAEGRVTDIQGRFWDVNSKGIVASNGMMHDEILRCLR